ncbi:hypothetical protein JCM8115_004008 [Rhodotorula mucilaginosa]
MDGEVPFSQGFLDRLFAGPSTLVGLVPLIHPLKDLLAAVGRVQTTMVSVRDLEVGHVYMLWSHRGDLLREKQCDEILDIDFYEKSLQIVSIEDLHIGIFNHISDLFEGSLVHSIAGIELLNSKEKEDWEKAYAQGCERGMHAKVTTSGEALLTVAKCTAAPDLIESVRARTDYTEEEKIHLEDMIDRTEGSTLDFSSPDWPGRTEEELADLNPGKHGLHLERSVINLAKGRAKDTLDEDYVARRNAVDFGVPLINNPLLADLYVQALGRKMKLGEVGAVSN